MSRGHGPLRAHGRVAERAGSREGGGGRGAGSRALDEARPRPGGTAVGRGGEEEGGRRAVRLATAPEHRRAGSRTRSGSDLNRLGESCTSCFFCETRSGAPARRQPPLTGHDRPPPPPPSSHPPPFVPSAHPPPPPPPATARARHPERNAARRGWSARRDRTSGGRVGRTSRRSHRARFELSNAAGAARRCDRRRLAARRGGPRARARPRRPRRGGQRAAPVGANLSRGRGGETRDLSRSAAASRCSRAARVFRRPAPVRAPRAVSPLPTARARLARRSQPGLARVAGGGLSRSCRLPSTPPRATEFPAFLGRSLGTSDRPAHRPRPGPLRARARRTASSQPDG